MTIEEAACRILCEEIRHRAMESLSFEKNKARAEEALRLAIVLFGGEKSDDGKISECVDKRLYPEGKE